jgi:tetratricopeptide (TPR) repeat protein
MSVHAATAGTSTPLAVPSPHAAPLTAERSWEAPMAATGGGRARPSASEASGRYRAAIEAAEQFGPEDLRRAGSLHRLAQLHREVGEDDEAEPLFRQALEIQERALGPAHPQVAVTLSSLMFLYRQQGKEPEAAAAAARVHTIMVTFARHCHDE